MDKAREINRREQTVTHHYPDGRTVTVVWFEPYDGKWQYPHLFHIDVYPQSNLIKN
jgi:hypothetical protein